jgi:hypothetical protein
MRLTADVDGHGQVRNLGDNRGNNTRCIKLSCVGVDMSLICIEIIVNERRQTIGNDRYTYERSETLNDENQNHDLDRRMSNDIGMPRHTSFTYSQE